MLPQFFIQLLIWVVPLNNKPFGNSSMVSDIPLPIGYARVHCSNNTFGHYLRNISLKKDQTVFLYNGEKKRNQKVQYAVLNITTGTKDLQQCADAVMRLRAEYLKQQNQPVCFSDNAGKSYCWVHYKQKGWQSYLETVFGMCGTLSLEKELKPSIWKNLQPGDVLIKGGSPGHAVIILDVAKHKISGHTIFILAQSYMPAQDMHILLNINKKPLSPWYSIPDDLLKTPEWTFTSTQLRAWP